MEKVDVKNVKSQVLVGTVLILIDVNKLRTHIFSSREAIKKT